MEYITRKQLKREIEQEVAAQAGRMSTLSLTDSLGVPSDPVERELAQIAQDPDSSLVYFSDSHELLNQDYNQRILEKLFKELEDTGIVRLREFCAACNLPIPYVQGLLNKYPTQESYDSNHGTLYKSFYAQKFESTLKVLLSACTRPILVSKLLIQHSELFYTSSLLEDAIKRFQHEHADLGKFIEQKKGGYRFYPTLFLQARLQWINNSLQKNFFVPRSMLDQLEASAEDLPAKIVHLPESVVSEILVHSLEESIAEACRSNDIFAFETPAVPDGLSLNDIQQLLRDSSLSSAITGTGLVFEGVYFVPNAFIDRCLKLFQRHYEEIAPPKIEEVKVEGTIILTSSSSTVSVPTPTNPEPSTDPTQATVLEHLRHWCPNQRKHEKALSKLASHLLPQVLTLARASASSSALSSEPSTSQPQKDSWMSEFEPLYLNLAFFLGAIPSALPVDSRSQLSQFAMESLGKSVISQLIVACKTKYLISSSDDDLATTVARFPSDVSKPLSSLLEASSNPAKKTPLSLIDAVLKSLGYSSPVLDAKTKTTIFETHRQSSASQLSTASQLEPSASLRLCLTLLYAVTSAEVLLTSTRHLQILIQALKLTLKADGAPQYFASKCTNDELVLTLDACYAALVAYIKAKQTKDANTIEKALVHFSAQFQPLLQCVNTNKASQ